ncbi:MAG: CDP-alcohol phosphatidyltransferase family protein [Steroidobacteraceae bacterium]
MDAVDVNRRPLKTRSTLWAQRLAAYLVSTAITPNQISVASVVVAGVGASVLLATNAPWALVVCAICIQLRLLCNLLDGMVAVEGGKQSALGTLYNEIPDRVADSLFLVPVGYVVHLPWLGWCCALLAALTAYIRVLGGTLGLPQSFRGPMAKPHRMALLTAACLLGACERALWGSQYALTAGLVLIGVGTAATCWTRTVGMARALQAGSRNTQ